MQARERGCLRLACAVALVLAATPASAEAAVLFASPTGPASGTCTSAPCELQYAVEGVALPGDEVIVSGGTYSEADDTLFVDGPIFVHGAAGQPVPQLVFTNPLGSPSHSVVVSDTALLARVGIRQTAGDAGDGALLVDGGTAEQLTVRIDGASSYGCRFLPPGGMLRDSSCWSSAGTGGVLVSVVGDNAPPEETVSATLRNVTAVGPSRGLLAESSGDARAYVDAKNVIAGGSTDIEATTPGLGNDTTVSLDNSNYATTLESGPMADVTPAGSGSNQIAPPHFTNAAAGDFHQLASSPTIDTGGTFFLMGSLDFDGQPRSVDGSASCFGDVPRPDIGADEFIPGALDCLSPETGINGGPKAKTRKRRAGFNFVATEIATFQCSLDERPFAPCTPPHVYRKLKPGKHEFNVRAVDAAGNLDASPAERRWRILKKKKKRKRKR